MLIILGLLQERDATGVAGSLNLCACEILGLFSFCFRKQVLFLFNFAFNFSVELFLFLEVSTGGLEAVFVDFDDLGSVFLSEIEGLMGLSVKVLEGIFGFLTVPKTRFCLSNKKKTEEVKTYCIKTNKLKI